MISSKPAQIIEILKSMKSDNPDIEALAVVSLDGLPIASLLPSDTEEDRVAALSATVLALGERTSEELGKGLLEQAYVKGENGYIITTGIKNLAALMVVTNKDSKLGMALYSIKRGIQEIEKIL
jgi:predicted regulator of Ras-like GTPase activity (Roadblock/LC7/MglB family)